MTRHLLRRAGAVLAGLGLLSAAGCATLPAGADRDTRQLYAAMRGCGVDTAPGRLAYDPTESLITLTAPVVLSGRQTDCLARVLRDRGLDLKSADLAFAANYAAAWERENALSGPRMAKLWLKRNRMGAVPEYDPERETLDAYVRKLEALCRAPSGSVQTTAEAVRVPWLEGEANERVSCVYLAALASNLKAAGIRVESSN